MENLRSRTALWLVTTLLNYRSLSLQELNKLWIQSVDDSGGEPMSRLQLQRAISAALDIMGIVIECERKNGYRYRIVSNENVKASEWLISSYTINQVVSASDSLRERILLEEAPTGQFHLSTIISAMKYGKALEMDYQKFADSEPVTCFIEPYCVKLSQLRWYLLACKDHRDHLQVFALDRIKQLRILFEQDFIPPASFSAHDYFQHYYGVHTGGNLLPMRICLRADQFWTKYLRTLPLHSSQCETHVMTSGSIFEYVMAVTPDLMNHLLSFGPGVEVLEPLMLRLQLADNIRKMAQIYCSEKETLLSEVVKL